MSIPKSMKAVVIQGPKAVVKDNVPVPTFSGTQVLIKTKAAAGNPTDWKHIAYKIGPEGAISGCDVAGEIVALGPEVDKSKFSIGDAIYGFVHGSSQKFPGNGAFCEYTAVDSKIAFKGKLTFSGKSYISPGPIDSFEAAASSGGVIDTAAAVLRNNFKVDLVWEPSKPQHDQPILVWGGATGVGQMLIQLAKKFNAFTKIIAVASKKHEALLKKFGADDVFDYHDSDVIKQIKSKYPSLVHLVDAVSTTDTFQQVYRCASDSEPAKIVKLTMVGEKDIAESERKSNVEIDGTMLYQIFGFEVPFGPVTLPADPKYRASGIEFIEFLTPKIAAGQVYNIPTKVYDGGLDSVPQILDDIQNNRNSGESLLLY